MSLGYRKLGRNSAQRKALLRDLVTDLIINGRIETTIYKAKELQRCWENGNMGQNRRLAARRQAARFIRFEKTDDGQFAIQKLFSEIAPKFADRNGGYTRILRVGPRRGDSRNDGDYRICRIVKQ